MARRRKKGLFDPDYRRAGWNHSAFAPKNSSLSITHLSLVIVFPIWAVVLLASPYKIINTVQGIGVSFGVMVFAWAVLAILIRRWAWRRVRHYVQQDQANPAVSGLAFDDSNVQPARRRWRRSSNIQRGQAFEQEVAWILNVLTDYKAVPVGGVGDGGVDVKVYAGSRLVGVVQCKCYRPGQALPPGHIRELYAAKQQFGVKTAYLATTAYFTQASQDEAKRLGIKLLDGAEIERMRRRAKVIASARDERQSVVR